MLNITSPLAVLAGSNSPRAVQKVRKHKEVTGGRASSSEASTRGASITRIANTSAWNAKAREEKGRLALRAVGRTGLALRGSDMSTRYDDIGGG